MRRAMARRTTGRVVRTITDVMWKRDEAANARGRRPAIGRQFQTRSEAPCQTGEKVGEETTLESVRAAARVHVSVTADVEKESRLLCFPGVIPLFDYGRFNASPRLKPPAASCWS